MGQATPGHQEHEESRIRVGCKHDAAAAGAVDQPESSLLNLLSIAISAKIPAFIVRTGFGGYFATDDPSTTGLPIFSSPSIETLNPQPLNREQAKRLKLERRDARRSKNAKHSLYRSGIKAGVHDQTSQCELHRM